MFYNHATLLTESINHTFNPKEMEDLFLKSENKTHPKNIKNVSFSSEFTYDFNKVSISLNAEIGTQTGTLKIKLARIKLATVPANCSSLFVHELWVKYQRTGLGSLLLKTVEDWATGAGYTMIHCNIPKYNALDYTYEFFEKNEYVSMIPPYINVRSGYLNKWYYKILQLPQEDDEE